jgi:hypothetical protein
MVADGGFLNFGCEDSQISEGQKFREIILKYRLGFQYQYAYTPGGSG